MNLYCLRRDVAGGVETFRLSAGLHTVGNRPNSDIVLSDSGVSRRHAVLEVNADAVELQDRASKNGSFVNGVRVRRHRLTVGDLVAFGDCELRFDQLDPDEAALAIELPIESKLPADLRTGAETTGLIDFIGSAGFAAATRATADMAQWLCRLDGADFGGALATLCATLGTPAAWLLEAPRLESSRPETPVDSTGGDRAVVLATYGSIGNASSQVVAERFAAAARGIDDPRPTVSDPGQGRVLDLPELPATGCLLADRNRTLGLWVVDAGAGEGGAGEGGAGEGARDLLRTALALMFLARTRTPALSGRRPGGVAGLALPDGYVAGTSPAMVELYRQLLPVARGDLPVLLLGETGVGKEYLAQIVHDSSPRRQRPFVAVNCAAIPGELLEAELFGVEKGAATGVAARRGTFQKAHRGTLLLDEIGDMSAELQAKLLRALQEQEIRPVGGSNRRIDVRVIAATNVDLESRIETGAFRADLYYRLAGCTLEVPALRHRREDIAHLVEHFVRREGAETGKSIRGVTVKALRALIRFDWPGNIRQLEHEVRRAVYMCRAGQVIDEALLSKPLRLIESLPTAGETRAAPGLQPPGDGPPEGQNSPGEPRREVGEEARFNLVELEKKAILEALGAAGGKKIAAARLLGISRDTLRRRMARHGLVEPAH